MRKTWRRDALFFINTIIFWMRFYFIRVVELLLRPLSLSLSFLRNFSVFVHWVCVACAFFCVRFWDTSNSIQRALLNIIMCIAWCYTYRIRITNLRLEAFRFFCSFHCLLFGSSLSLTYFSLVLASASFVPLESFTALSLRLLLVAIVICQTTENGKKNFSPICHVF